MPTNLKEVRPAKTLAGSVLKLLWLRSRELWGEERHSPVVSPVVTNTVMK